MNLNNENDLDCELTFQFLQFKIHLNLKSDYEYERFYEKCKDFLIKVSNNFNSSLKSCFNDVLLREKDKNDFYETNLITSFMTDYFFLLTILAFLSLMGPVTVLICIHFYVTSGKFHFISH